MKIDRIQVTAGRTFNHPFEQYSNFRCDAQLHGHLEEGEDPIKATQEMQATVEKIVEDHKQDLLKNIRNLEKISRCNEEISALEERMQQADTRLKSLRRSVSAYHGGEALELHPSDAKDDDEGFLHGRGSPI